MKLAFYVEASAWKKSLGVSLSNRYKQKLYKITEYIQEKNKILSRNIKDLEDVRVAMKCLGEIRNDFISLDMELILIEEAYTLMGKFNVDISKEEHDIVDGLRYNFSNMLHTVSTCGFYLSLLSSFDTLSCWLIISSSFQVTLFLPTINNIHLRSFYQAKGVQAVICEMQEPLRNELVEGVTILKQNVIEFDIDFEFNGPMVEGIPAKEASER